MNLEAIERFLKIVKELNREAIEEEYARDMEILEVSGNLLGLISAQIASMERRLDVLKTMLDGATMARDLMAQKKEGLDGPDNPTPPEPTGATS